MERIYYQLCCSLAIFFLIIGISLDVNIEAARTQNPLPLTTIYVDDDAPCPGDGTIDTPYCKIQYAVDNASTGDDIKIASGEYYERIIITEEISLDWHGSDILGSDTGIPVINGAGIGIVILIGAPDVTITRCKIINSGTTDLDAGIYIGEHSTDVTILNNEISDCFFGIWVNRITPEETNHDIRENIIDNIIQQGVLISFSDGNTVYDNEITNCGWHGVHIRDCNENRISGNVISDNEFGLILDVGLENEVEFNSCERNTRWGLVVINTQKTVIANNNFVDNGIGQATWINARGDKWFQNYWGQKYFAIHLVGGTLRGADLSIPWFRIELSPSSTPNVP